MSDLKRYWWLLLIVPVVGYFLWRYYQHKKEVNASAARAREARAEKAALKTLVENDVKEN